MHLPPAYFLVVIHLVWFNKIIDDESTKSQSNDRVGALTIPRFDFARGGA
jgi:hypothetical protein